MLLAAPCAHADHAPNYVVPGRPDVPVIINFFDASWGVVEGEWGLYRPGAVSSTVIPAPYVMPRTPRNPITLRSADSLQGPPRNRAAGKPPIAAAGAELSPLLDERVTEFAGDGICADAAGHHWRRCRHQQRPAPSSPKRHHSSSEERMKGNRMFRVTLGLATATFFGTGRVPRVRGLLRFELGLGWRWLGWWLGRQQFWLLQPRLRLRLRVTCRRRFSSLWSAAPPPVFVQAPPQQVIVQQSQPEVIFQQAAIRSGAELHRRSGPVLFRSGNDRLSAASILCRSAGSPVSVCVGGYYPTAYFGRPFYRGWRGAGYRGYRGFGIYRGAIACGYRGGVAMASAALAFVIRSRAPA